MKAIFFRKHGDSSVLEYGDVQEPPLKSNAVLVRVKAVALNHLDIWVRIGWSGLKLPLPHVLGSDVAGIVERVGPEVTDLKSGDPVVINPGLSCGHCNRCLLGEDNLCKSYQILGEHTWGGYAEFVVVPRQNVLPKPSNLSFEQAACLPLTFLTAWTMLIRRAHLGAGETVLVHAAGSGVGSAAVQIAKLVGAQVIATACPFCIQMFEDGIPTVQPDDTKRMKTYDVAELLELTVIGRPSGGSPAADAMGIAEPAGDPA